jgi:broad specificity phosphatase PhoE
MQEIEIRRHSCTKKGEGRGKGSHLSSDGVALARELGQAMGRFDLVLASEVPRTAETAIAMGFAVDDLIETVPAIAWPALDAIGHQERWAWETPWARFAELVARDATVAAFGEWLKHAWEDALAAVPEGGRVLVISHGRFIEVGAITCLAGSEPSAYATWGEPLHHGEGIRLSYDNERFGAPYLLRTRRCQG